MDAAAIRGQRITCETIVGDRERKFDDLEGVKWDICPASTAGREASLRGVDEFRDEA